LKRSTLLKLGASLPLALRLSARRASWRRSHTVHHGVASEDWSANSFTRLK
jgi:hypothetical protein